MPRFSDPISLTPREYELAVKSILDGAGVRLDQFQSQHLERLPGVDGDYVIDVTARFSALGADFLVLVECKNERRKTERHDVQVLRDKMQSIGAQKGMLFSTAGFQEGAIEYADAHKIALVQLVDGKSTWFTKFLRWPNGTTTLGSPTKICRLVVPWTQHECHVRRPQRIHTASSGH